MSAERPPGSHGGIYVGKYNDDDNDNDDNIHGRDLLSDSVDNTTTRDKTINGNHRPLPLTVSEWLGAVSVVLVADA